MPHIAMFLLFLPFLLLLQCSTFNDSEFSPAIALEKLRNKHLVMIGDSLMRYNYLSLVYALKFGVKLVDSDYKNFVREPTFLNWFDYYVVTNRQLHPNEYCDCYRTPDGVYNYQFENRFYEDKEKGIKVTFLLLYGKFNQGHWSNATDSDTLRLPTTVYKPAVWKTDLPDTFHGFLKDYVGDRNASVLVLNAGFHFHHFKEEGYCKEVASRAVALFGQVFWKTTSCETPTKRKGYPPLDHPHDTLMCSQLGLKCFNISWVKNVPDEEYTDTIHYKAPVYNVMNAQLMSIMDDLN